MLDSLTIVQTQAQPAAVIRLRIPREEIRQAMAPAISEVIEAVIDQGIGPAGPVFSHHFDMQPGIFHFEVGVPVSGTVQSVGRVQPGQLPAATVARTIYTGPYERLGEAWGEFLKRVEAEGHQTAANLWERYVTGAESSPDPSTYRTELNRPLL